MKEIKEIKEPELLHSMATYCSAAERCRQEVTKKILAAGLDTDAAGRIIARLEEEKFIDESRYCKAFVNDKLRYNKWGRIKIQYELRKKQLPAATIAAALDEIDEKMYDEMLWSLLKKKKPSVKGADERTVNNRLVSFAVGRGFTAHETFACLAKMGITVADEDTFADDWD